MSTAERVFLIAWILALAACGGGGATNETAAPPVTVETLSTGVFSGRFEYRRVKISRKGARSGAV